MPRGTTGFRISYMAAQQASGILTFVNILVKLCIYPYIVNHVIWIALFGTGIFRIKSGILESSQESRIPAKISNHVEENSVSDPALLHACIHFRVLYKQLIPVIVV